MSTTDQTNPATASQTEEIKQGLIDYLRGFAKANPERLADTAAYAGWQQLAQAELNRRRFALIETLPIEVIEQMANGEIDLAQTAKELQPK